MVLYAKILFIFLLGSFSRCLCSPIGPDMTNFTQTEVLDYTLKGPNASHSQQYAKRGERVCMKELGCFNLTDDFFHPLYRPINLLPYDRVTINTKFHLYTKSHPKESYDLLVGIPECIENAPLNPEVPTKFIVHGFLDSRLYGRWLEVLKDNMLLQGEYNVIIVDWSGGNSPPYAQAAANCRVVGAEIALMITKLQKIKGISPMDCHIIGHSLGSHAAGYAGERLKTLGRISGVDPAEPYFQNMPPSVRLDTRDADFVDVIHTDSKSILLLGLGMSQAIGHVDFYPNDGKNQPGCLTDPIRSIFMEGLIDATRRFVACNHQRAVDFFTFSINYRKALPVAYECPSWKDYLNGKCSDCGQDGRRCAVLGIQAADYRPLKNDSRSVKLYLSTSGSAPYWVYHYHVSVKLYKPKTDFKDRKGKMTVILHGTKNAVKFNIASKAIDLYHGATYTFLVTTNIEVGSVKSVTFTWESASWNFLSTPTLFLEKIKIVPMNIISRESRKNEEKTFCDKPSKAIKPKTSVSLSNTQCS